MIKLTSSLCPGENIRGTQTNLHQPKEGKISALHGLFSPHWLCLAWRMASVPADCLTPGNVCVKKSCETIMPIKYLQLCVNVYGVSITSTSMFSKLVNTSKHLSLPTNKCPGKCVCLNMFLFSGIPPIYGHFEWKKNLIHQQVNRGVFCAKFWASQLLPILQHLLPYFGTPWDVRYENCKWRLGILGINWRCSVEFSMVLTKNST